MLNSVLGHVTAAVIIDTGSDDGTPEFCKAFFKKHGIPCHVVTAEFKNFEQARNLALRIAQHYHVGFDYILLMDADMELKVDGPLPDLVAESYGMVQRAGGMSYYNTRLVRKGSPAKYHGVTHEYLSVSECGQIPDTGSWWFYDHASGSNRVDKYERDTRLLEGYLVDHPDDGRTLFYLAQTYRDRGLNEKAIELYRKRMTVGGWDEEVWYSQLQVARSFRALGNEPEFVVNALLAYNKRPSRVEPLMDLARYYREKNDQQQTGWLFAEKGATIPYPKDLLFVEQWAYEWGITEELSILGSYNDKTKTIGFKACDKLSLMKAAPAQTRDTARRNLFWYLRPLKELAPSFAPVKVPDMNLDKVYTNSNPSLTVFNGALWGIVRTVSYRIRPDGTYDYNGLSAIRTTNYLVKFNEALMPTYQVQLQRPTGFPVPVSTEILDVEDMRLFESKGELWANGCVLEQNTQYWREQFLMKINPDTGECTDWRRIDPQGVPKQNEKNWMPVEGLDAWMYKPGYVMNHAGVFTTTQEHGFAANGFSGGGNVIPMDCGWLALVHEAKPDPTNGKRYYQHRFVWFDQQYVMQKVSLPFVFFDRQIEFACGLVRSGNNVIIGFGVLDREAWVATISDQDVRDLVWHL